MRLSRFSNPRARNCLNAFSITLGTCTLSSTALQLMFSSIYKEGRGPVVEGGVTGKKGERQRFKKNVSNVNLVIQMFLQRGWVRYLFSFFLSLP